MTKRYLVPSMGILVVAALLASAAAPYDRATWLLEVSPVLVAIPLLVLSRRRFPLTPMLYSLIAVHALILIMGGTYTYARVPLGEWLQELLGLTRNPYDKLGHFAQGFVPALIAREILIRGGHVQSRRMTAFLSICVAESVSACYEIVEWWVALAFGQGAYDFLGTQGDIWDTQSDMFFALIGAGCAMILLTRTQDHQISAINCR